MVLIEVCLETGANVSFWKNPLAMNLASYFSTLLSVYVTEWETRTVRETKFPGFAYKKQERKTTK